jgi:hypothetical protein
MLTAALVSKIDLMKDFDWKGISAGVFSSRDEFRLLDGFPFCV